MSEWKEMKPARVLMGRLGHGKDLLAELTDLVRQNDVRLGRVQALGAVQRARVGYYDQGTRTYHYHDIPRPTEITNLTGNVSLKDGEPVIHAHLTLADEKGHAFGGHLGEGTIIWACEFVLDVYDGPDLNRAFDEPTSLPLWDMKG